MSKAGYFEIEVSGPYPCWCELSYGGKRMMSLHHNELSDLEYVVKKAMQEARTKLPEKDRHEV